MEILTGFRTQTALPEMGKKETILYYVLFKGKDETFGMNIGKKSYDTIKKMLEEEEKAKTEEKKEETKTPKK